MRGGGVALVGWLLQGADPALMDVNVLMAAQLLVEVVAAAKLPRLLHQFYHSVLLDFRWCPLLGVFSWLFPVLRIRDVLSWIPDPNFFPPGSEFFHPGSRIRIKELKYFDPKKWFLSSRKYDPDCSSGIRILIFYPSRIPDPGVKKAPDPGSSSATLVYSTPFLSPIEQ
jgi:hypothetical protein